MDKPYGLPLTETLLSEELQNIGYNTHLVGKWHLGYYSLDYTPTYRGFDTFYGFYGAGITKYNHTATLKKGPWNRLEGYDFRDGTDPITGDGEYITDLLTSRALNILDNKTTDDPFFLYMSYSNPHSPIETVQDYIDLYNESNINDTDRINFNSMVSHVDNSISQIVDKLIEKNLWDNTLLIFSSDNGPALYRVKSSAYPLRGAKSGLFEGAVRVPAFISGGYLPESRRGTKYRQLTHMTDWLPTIAGVVGFTPTSNDLDGNDLSNLILQNIGKPIKRTELLINDDSQNEKCVNNVTLNNGTVLGPICGALIKNNYKIVIGFQATVSIEEYNGWIDNGLIENANPTINCNGVQPDWKDAVSDAPFKNENEGALYNLIDDPCEYSDIKNDYLDIYEDLLTSLYEYNLVADTPIKGQTDPEPGRANPINNGGWWSSWR